MMPSAAGGAAQQQQRQQQQNSTIISNGQPHRQQQQQSVVASAQSLQATKIKLAHVLYALEDLRYVWVEVVRICKLCLGG